MRGMIKSAVLLLFIVFTAGCTQKGDFKPVEFVNPFIGTDGHGHTFPGAALPFGMVQLSPDTRKDNWDACSGYHYSDSVILGFSHTHLSGTGVGDYGDIRFMPMTGKLNNRPGTNEPAEPGYRSGFSHGSEEASPGYYKVYLTDHKTGVELTATRRCGFHKYTFPSSDESHLIIDLKESVVSEKILESSVRIINDHEISGFRRTSGWAEDQVVYFYAEFSKPFSASGIFSNGTLTENNQADGKDIQAFVRYSTKDGEAILVKVGISAVSEEGALKNLRAEIPDWDFERVRNSAADEWNRELGKIEVRDKNRDNLTKFYTALYHAFLAPYLFSDADGRYRGHDGAIHHGGFDVYTVFSLWDTYRALHPLMTIVQPERTNDFIKTFIDIYEKGGLLPVWELAGNETFCMIGYHAVPVIADAYLKGYRGFDHEKAFAAMKGSAGQDHYGLDSYRKFGFIPAEAEGEAVSKTLEYAYDDWCIAKVAAQMGREEDYRNFIMRAQYYKNLFDPETGFLRGKRNGMFAEPFDPAEVNFMLTEANTWQYTFYAPQDISGLMALMGGKEQFENRLDEMFSAPENLSGRQQADITGLIGQYAHGNEPSHHMAYLYNYTGSPDKTQRLVRQIMDELYGTGPDGLCGNEDCGQMSAWFVLSAMGFYPVTPGSGYYVIGSPLFDEVILHLEGGKTFQISARGNDERNIYIQSASLNGKSYTRSYIDNSDIMNGGVIAFTLGPEPGLEWGKGGNDIPETSILDPILTPIPYYKSTSASFQDSIVVELRHVDPDARLFYNTGEIADKNNFVTYTAPIHSDVSLNLSAYAETDGQVPSSITNAAFHKIDHEWHVSITHLYNSQYTGGGDIALIDRQYGGPNFRTGSWQGYHGVDFEAVIDLGRMTFIHSLSARFLHDQRSWIFLPGEVEFSLSEDNIHYKKAGTRKSVFEDKSEIAQVVEYDLKDVGMMARYIKVNAKNRGVCPEWHVGSGEKAWLFIDEIGIE